MTADWAPPLIDPGEEAGPWSEVLTFLGKPIALEGTGLELTVLPSVVLAPGTIVASVSLSGLREPMLTRICEFPFASLCDVDLSPSDIDLLPQGLRHALYEGMLAAICSHLAPAIEPWCRLQDVHALEEMETGTKTLWFEILLTLDGQNWARAQLGFSRADALRVFSDDAADGVPIKAMVAPGMAIPVHFTIGWITLSFSQFGELMPGSIIVMAKRAAGTCHLRIRDAFFSFAETPDGWCCTNLEFVPGSVPHGSMSSTGDQQLTLVFEIGSRKVPLDELACWREGVLIELEPPEADEGCEVTIRANGRLIGSGDVIRIDDRIATRITRLIS